MLEVLIRTAFLDHDHAMMDEYDVLMAQIKKYSGLAPEEIRRRTWQVGVIESMALVHIRHGRVSVTVARPDPTKVIKRVPASSRNNPNRTARLQGGPKGARFKMTRS